MTLDILDLPEAWTLKFDDRQQPGNIQDRQWPGNIQDGEATRNTSSSSGGKVQIRCPTMTTYVVVTPNPKYGLFYVTHPIWVTKTNVTPRYDTRELAAYSA